MCVCVCECACACVCVCMCACACVCVGVCVSVDECGDVLLFTCLLCLVFFGHLFASVLLLLLC